MHVVFAGRAGATLSWPRWRPNGASARAAGTDCTLWTIDEQLVARLAERQDLRQSWTVTLVGDHIYVEVDRRSYDGAVTRG